MLDWPAGRVMALSGAKSCPEMAVPVMLNWRVMGTETSPKRVIVNSPPSPVSEPLASVAVSDAALEGARQSIRDRVYAAELTLAALLILSGLMLGLGARDERNFYMTASTGEHR